MHLAVAPIVEGHGDVAATRLLIERIIAEVREASVTVLRPIRKPRGRLVSEAHDDLERAVRLAALKLGAAPATGRLILLLVDADDDCPAHLGPRLRDRMVAARSDMDVYVALATVEFETWFVGAAESLSRFFGDPIDLRVPPAPESVPVGKHWVRRHAGRYSETVDQPRMTAAMDLGLAASRCPSLARLVAALRQRVQPD